MAHAQEVSPKLYHYLQRIESTIDITKIDKWLRNCTTGKQLLHKGCPDRDVSSRNLPKRLIDVGEYQVWPCLPRLLESTLALSDKHRQPKYIALSHSWGTMSAIDQDSMTITMQNIVSRRHGMDINGLPAKYREAMILCRCLRIRYLWIDSLCIIQVSILMQSLSIP